MFVGVFFDFLVVYDVVGLNIVGLDDFVGFDDFLFVIGGLYGYVVGGGLYDVVFDYDFDVVVF